MSNHGQTSATAPVSSSGSGAVPASSAGNANNLAQVAQGQILQAAAATAAPVMDLASVLAKIQALEKEKADMRSHLETVTSKLSKLQESKQTEMEQMMNTTISKWLENLNTTDAGAKVHAFAGCLGSE